MIFSLINIIVFSPNWLGDILFSIPSFLAIKKHYPKSHLVPIVPPQYADLLKSQPYVDDVIALSEKKIINKFRLFKELRKKEWHIGFLFHRSKTRARFLKWANIPKIVGYNTKNRGYLLTDAIAEPQKPIHKMDHLLGLLEKVGIRTVSRSYVFIPSQEAVLMPKPYIVFHPGSNWEPKRWPTSYYAKLGDMLSSAFGVHIVMTGTPSDKKLAQDIQNQMSHPSTDLTGQTTLPQLANICFQSSLVIAGDTGPMHLAAASGTRVFAIYGPTSPILNGPRAAGNCKIIWKNPGCKDYPCQNPSCEHASILNKIIPQHIFESISAWDFSEKIFRGK